jgi:hypothetical protein
VYDSMLAKKHKDSILHNGIDRVDSSAGYTVDNSAPCCKTCNAAKRSLSVQEFLAWVESVVDSKPSTPTSYDRENRSSVQVANHLWRTYRSGAVDRGHLWDLSREDFDSLIFGTCRYCGAVESMTSRRHKHVLKRNGIDRIESSIGYQSDNVVSCCINCNFAKASMSVDQFYAWVYRVASHSLSPTAHTSNECATPS